jgi:ABC-2 type transport system permease protein
MTATTTPTFVPERRGLTFGGILNSEFIKLRTLRSTVWCYAIIVAITLGLGLLLAGTYTSDTPLPGYSQQAIWLLVSTIGVAFGQLVIAVLGALVITGEYGTGMIRSTLTAVPKRIPALAAKALVFGVVTFVIAFIAILLTALLVAPILPSRGVQPDFGDSAIWLALLGAAVALALVGVLSLSIGAIIRNSAGGVAISLGLLLVLPTIVSIFAAVTRLDWIRNVEQFLPNQAAGRMYAYVSNVTVPSTTGTLLLEPWQAVLVLVAWVAVFFALAAVLLKRRDA